MKPNVIASVVLAVLGLFYAAAPHSIHVSSGIGLGLEHSTHVILGVALVLLGAVLYFWGRKGTRKKRK